MYLVSIYFDEETNKIINRYIRQTAKKTGNTFMTDENVPPHITVSAFETKQETEAAEQLGKAVAKLNFGKIQWVSAGAFFPYVLYIAPVLNHYLQNMSEIIYESVRKTKNPQISPYYQPFSWFPHATIGKKLSREELRSGFEVLQNSFVPFQGEVVRIGLAKTNPYHEIKNWELGKQ